MLINNTQVNNKDVITPKPETEEYNVRNFVYRRYRPFHPERLQRLIFDKFILQLEHPDDQNDEDEPDERVVGKESNRAFLALAKKRSDETTEASEDGLWENEEDVGVDGLDSSPSAGSEKSNTDTIMTSPISAKHLTIQDNGDLIAPSNEVILENKRTHPLLGRLFRSKGIFWLATRSGYSGMWSQAGAMLTLLSDRRWFCTYTPDELATWCPDEELRRQIQRDVDAGKEWGDRRQEIVFIGEKLDVKGLEALLDECLVSDMEWEMLKPLERTIRQEGEVRRKATERMDEAKESISRMFKDGFPDWPAHYPDEEPEENDEEEEEEEGHIGHHHH